MPQHQHPYNPIALASPWIVAPETPLLEALAKMVGKVPTGQGLDARTAGCILVGDRHQLRGIVTQGDVVRLVAQRLSLDGQSVADAMTSPVITLQFAELSDPNRVLSCFQHHSIRHLPLLDDQAQVVGLLTLEAFLQHQVVCSPAPLRPAQRAISPSSEPTDGALPAILADQQQWSADLQDRYRKQAAILAVLPDLMFRVNGEGVYLEYLTSPYVKDLQAADSNSVGKSLFAVLPPQLAQRKYQAIQRALATGERQVFEQLLQVGGVLQHEEVQVVPIHDEEALIIIRNVGDRKKTEQTVQFQAKLLNQVSDAVVALDPQYRITYCNQAALDQYGLTAAEAIGSLFSDCWQYRWLSPEDEQQAKVALQAEGRWRGENIHVKRNGEKLYVELTVSHLKDEGGQQMGWLVSIRDVSDRTHAEETLRQSEARFRTIFDTAAVGIAIVSPLGQYLLVNPSICQMLGYTEAELLAHSFRDVTHPDDVDLDWRYHQQLLRGTLDHFHLEKRYLHKNGQTIWTLLSVSVVRDAQRQFLYSIALVQDISDRKQAETLLLHNARHDSLTGLPNRNLLMERLELAIHRLQRVSTYGFAVLFLDLDRFKVVNDSLGHVMGDQLLVTVAQTLQSQIRAVDLAARLGGDEFVILLEDITRPSQAVRVAEQILQKFQSPCLLKGRDVYITPSIGIVLGTAQYTQASDLLRDADIAMYQAKAHGRNAYQVFNSQMHTQAIQRLDLENELRKALERREFVVHYQPIVSLEAQQLVGFEALIRWQHPTRGFVSPADFIPLAEETGLIVLLDQWVLEVACQQLAVWQAQFPQTISLKVSVNLCDQDFHQVRFIDRVDEILRKTGLKGHALSLEITEGVLVKDIFKTIDILNRLQSRGVQISIDDFGTGYSSLSYLHRLPLDTLKVDRSFVSQMQEGSRNYQIVKTIIALSNQLGIQVIAEGIETQQQLTWLQTLGCELGQGYFFAKPLNADAIEALIKTIQPDAVPTLSC